MSRPVLIRTQLDAPAGVWGKRGQVGHDGAALDPGWNGDKKVAGGIADLHPGRAWHGAGTVHAWSFADPSLAVDGLAARSNRGTESESPVSLRSAEAGARDGCAGGRAPCAVWRLRPSNEPARTGPERGLDSGRVEHFTHELDTGKPPKAVVTEALSGLPGPLASAG